MKTPVRNVANNTLRFHANPPVSDKRTLLQADRLALVEETCRLHASEIAGDVERVYVYEAGKVAYCSTHKIASTFWTRLFRWLYNDTRVGHVSSPLDISKLDTHLLPLKNLRVRDVAGKHEDRTIVEASYRFLFTREPFARLWSVYIDKFLLPDNYFWSYYAPRVKASVYGEDDRLGRPILVPPIAGAAEVRMGRENVSALYKPHKANLSQQQNTGLLKGASNNTNGRIVWNNSSIINVEAMPRLDLTKTVRKRLKAKCLNVTFEEFIQYIVNLAVESTGKALDDHFRPIHYGCNPCKFRPHFIGRMESMRGDSGEVLSRMKLEHLLPELNAFNHVQQEIDMLIDFNFELVVTRGYQQHCVTEKDLERRLIKAFVYNGYIAKDSESILEGQLPMGPARLKSAVTKMYEQSNRTSADIKRQRAKFKTEAYKKMPLNLLHSLQKVFHWDFELFGYDPFPSELFHM